MTAITAIHRTFGIVCSEFVEGPVTQFVFVGFLKNLFNIMNRNQIRPIYVMDNVRFHKTKLIQELFNKTNNNCLLTAPWSCELNPIEYIFGIWKNRIIIPRNVQLSDIRQLIIDGLLTITKEEVSKSIYFVETIIFQLALQRKNLVLETSKHYFHNEYLNVGGDESRFLNYDPEFIMEDANELITIDDNEETTLCSFTSNIPLFDQRASEQQNDTISIQNSDDSNSVLNSPILLDDSFDNSSEYVQNSTINSDNNEQTLIVGDCSSQLNSSEQSSHSFANEDISKSVDNDHPNHDSGHNLREDSNESFSLTNESISQSSDNDIFMSENRRNNDQLNSSEQSSHSFANEDISKSVDNDHPNHDSGPNLRKDSDESFSQTNESISQSSDNDICMSENRRNNDPRSEQTTKNNKNLSFDRDDETWQIFKKLAAKMYHKFESSRSVSSENSSSKSSDD